LDAVSLADLTDIRADFTSTLTTPCTLWKPDRETAGLTKGGATVLVGQTVCSVNLQGGSANPFINSLLRQMTAKVPGARTISFRWDETVDTGYEVRIGSADFQARVYNTPVQATGDARYKLGPVDNDDPNRFGIQVSAEIVTAT
jgi:hypothetical protein